MKLLARLQRDRKAASAAEYALILGIVGAAVVAAAIVLGGSIGGEMNEAASCVSDSGSC